MLSKKLGQRFYSVSFYVFLSIMLSSGVIFAQITTGAIQGTVQDPSGSVIPGAKDSA